MRTETRLLFVVTILLFLSSLNYGQSELIIEPFATTQEFLEVPILADSTSRPADRVYVLRRGGAYYMSISLDILDYTLRIKAEAGEGAKPVIYAFRNTNGSYNAQLFNVYTAIELTNISLVGWAEGTEDFDRNVTRLVNVASIGGSINLDNCILSTASATLVQTSAAGGYVRATNTVFTHSSNLKQTNLGNGRAFDFRDVAVDSVFIQNCSFFNFTDRVIRHYNAKATLKNFFLDHNTFYNGLAEHGCLSLGRIEGGVQITNNLFVDNFLFGNDSTATQSDGRLVEFAYTEEVGPSGAPRMTFVGSVPNDTTAISWDVRNNYYSISPSVQAFYDSHPELDELIPLTWHINKKLGADSVNAFTKVAAPVVFEDAPAIAIPFAEWFFKPIEQGGAGKSKSNANFSLDIGFDRRDIAYLDGTLDLAYQTTSDAYTGAQGYPVGDLNWYPDKKAAWIQDPVGVDAVTGLPTEFSLDQNYPNPFNPSTKIVYNVPVQSQIQLDVFDVLGRRVTTLVNEVQPAGQHIVNFDASQLSSGVYFYRLSTQNLTLSKKMILMK